MAELNVQPKKKSPWWLWLLIALAVLALIFYFLRNDDNEVETEDDYEPETGSVYTPSPASYAVNKQTVPLYSTRVA